MKKILLLAMFGVLVFAAGCKKGDVQPGSGADSSGTVDTSVEPTYRGETETNPNLKTIRFDFDKSELSASAIETLKDNAKWLLKNPKVNIVVEGHTDERGTTEYNLTLAQRRASTVRQYYIQLGVAGNRIATISYGEEKPANPASNEAAWSENRRSESKNQK
ncbi:peptidoglycan-associated lipoprotein Pal [Endomicrobium proavitum]|uniref:Peptidoglycan-associated lipoprotein n=1 Tax=Endomicrobium proavitum TaxID=1408281 RepID=A0A0G3WJR9_9BACT|nr:peptidoglycan-associated lipoprotein Pal [Endomicrobium proavitum]AKL98125.1 peptidoglycan-associated lipoprotein [Endomicrobium proavitum]